MHADRREAPAALVFGEARGISGRALGVIERVGNRLPHPFYLFLILAGVVAVSSAIAAAGGATTTDPSSGESVPVRNVLSPEGLVYALTSTVTNFIGFPAFGLVLTVMLGIGVAERSGLLDAVMRGAVLAAPRSLVTFVVVVVSLMGNLASNSAIAILPPLAALAFLAAGRHPLAGFITSYAAVLAGFTANVAVAGTDVLMAGITTSAAQLVDPAAQVGVLSNWYFFAASTVILAVTITIVCQRYLEPQLGAYRGTGAEEPAGPLQPVQRRGLLVAGICVAVSLTALLTAALWPGSPLQGQDGDLLESPFMDGLPVFLLLLFVIAGVAYGIPAGSVRRWSRVPEMMGETLRELVPFIVMAFAAAQAIAWFEWSRIGLLLAEAGADLLSQAGLGGPGGLLLFSVLAAIPALLMVSGSAIWAMLAPVFVPMFMVGGVDPAFVQAAFRITDSATNTLVPLNPLLPLILGLMQRWEPKGGFGTLIGLVLPFTVAIWVVWLLQLLVWSLAGLPVGPGHGLYLSQ